MAYMVFLLKLALIHFKLTMYPIIYINKYIYIYLYIIHNICICFVKL